MDEVEKGFRRRKYAFLNDVESKINRYIVSRGKNCIAVVERNNDGSVYCTWDFGDDLDDLAKHVYQFMRKKRSSSGHMHDSALTDPIIDIVTKEYKAFYASEEENISNGILVALSSDEVKLQSFVDRISDIALKGLSKEAKKQVVKLVVHQIRDSISDGALQSVGDQVGHIASTTAGTQVAAVVGHLLLKLLAAHIGAIVAHVLASAAIHNMLMLIAKKFVLATVTAAVLHFLTVNFGAALAGSSIMWIVLPIVVGILTYKIHEFPKKLGKKVSESVREDLDGQFDELNKTILEKVFDSVFKGDELVEAIASDEKFQDAMRDLGNEVEPVLVKSKDYVTTSVREIKSTRKGWFGF